MKKIKCPFCKADLREYLMYVGEGCTNYIYYSLRGDKWFVDGELDGENSPETYWACKLCSRQLPEDMQKFFEELVD